MLPPGPHLVSYCAKGSQGDFGPVTCFFTHPSAGQVCAEEVTYSNMPRMLLPPAGRAALLLYKGSRLPLHRIHWMRRSLRHESYRT